MDNKKKPLVIFFFFGFFLLLKSFIFTEPAQARLFGGRFRQRRQARFNQNRTYQPVKAKALSKPSAESTPAKTKQPVSSKNLSSGSGSSRGLTADEQKVRQRRQANYDQWFPEWGGKREKVNPGKAAQVASARAKNLSKEGRQAYSATQQEDVARYKKKQGVTAIDAIDPLTGAEIKFRRSKENGLNVYKVKDEATGLSLHKLEGEAKDIIALSASGIKIKVGYGDPNNPQWASNGYYSTNLKELNVFAGFNRSDDHLIRAITPAAESPSDLGQSVLEPIRYTLKNLTTFAQAKDPYSGDFLRPELSVLMKSDALSQNAKLKIATGMLENTSYGRVISTSNQLEKITRVNALGDSIERDYAVYGSRNYRGQSIYFAIELESRPLKPDQRSLESLAEPLADPAKPLASLERLVEKPPLTALPKWVAEHIEKRTFSWFPQKTWEEVTASYGDIRVEKIRSYSDESRGSIFHEVKIIQPNGGRIDIMLFRLDKLTR